MPSLAKNRALLMARTAFSCIASTSLSYIGRTFSSFQTGPDLVKKFNHHASVDAPPAHLHNDIAQHNRLFFIFNALPPHFNLQQKVFFTLTLHFPTKCLCGKQQLTNFAENTVATIIALGQSFVNHTHYFPYQIVLCAHPAHVSFATSSNLMQENAPKKEMKD